MLNLFKFHAPVRTAPVRTSDFFIFGAPHRTAPAILKAMGAPHRTSDLKNQRRTAPVRTRKILRISNPGIRHVLDYMYTVLDMY